MYESIQQLQEQVDGYSVRMEYLKDMHLFEMLYLQDLVVG
jgi:hypothetical protein